MGPGHFGAEFSQFLALGWFPGRPLPKFWGRLGFGALDPLLAAQLNGFS